MAEQTEPPREVFTSCWFGERLLPFANACINTFKAHGVPFCLYTHGAVRDVPAFVTGREVDSIVAKDEVFIAHGGVETSTELFIYRFLERYGGWYVDNDVVCNADHVPDVEIAFAEERAGIINNAVLKFPSHHPAIQDLLDYVATIDQVNAPWGTTGPLALTKIFAEHNLASYKRHTSEFYPLHWKEAPKVLFPEFTAEVRERIADSPFIHLWGSTLREIGFDCDASLPPEGSYLHSLYTRHLDPHILQRLTPMDERRYRTFVRDYIERTWNVSLAFAG
jgi:hypothetical protein